MSLYLAVFDETQNSAGDFTLGGFLGPDADWREYFEPAWAERVLGARPRIPYLHMTDIRDENWRRKHDLTAVEASRRIDEAVRVIRSMGSLYPITASIRVPDFHSLLGDFLKKMGGFGEIALEPDYLSYIGFVTSTLEYTARRVPAATRVDFLAEKSQKTTEVIKLFHEGLREALVPRLDAPRLFGELSSAGKTSTALQRADASRLHAIDAGRIWKLVERHGFRFVIDAADVKELSDHL